MDNLYYLKAEEVEGMRQRRKSEKFKAHEGLNQLVLTLKMVTKQSVEIENNLHARAHVKA